jgi:hypothetical protein
MLYHTLPKALLLSVLALGAMAAACPGQVTLKHKFHEGSSQVLETTARIEQSLTIAGMAVETASDTRATTKISVGARDVEGKLRVQEKAESLQISMDVMGMKYEFDSANPDNKGGSPLEILRDVHKALLRRTTTIVFDKADKAVAVESDEDTLGTLPAEVQSLVKSQLDSEHLKTEANDAIEQIKREPIKKGDTWQRQKSVNFGAGQLMDFKTEYTYDGTAEKDGKTYDKITSKNLSVTFALDNSPLPFSLKGADLKSPESEGVILFDREQGQVVESTSKVRVTGEITFSLNGKDLPAKLDLKMQSSTIVKN